MPDIQMLKGDPHNFGKMVIQINDHLIHKPRTVFWEWLFLSHHSPLRMYLDSTFRLEKVVVSPFEVMPNLQFEFLDSGETGNISLLKWSKDLPLDLDDKCFESIGAVMGLCMWFGISDLHNENFAVGKSDDVPFIFSPIDIEAIFYDLALPSQSFLIPSKNKTMLGTAIDALSERITAKNVASIIYGYIATLQMLNQKSDDIFRLLFSIEKFPTQKVRMIVRDTEDYKIWLEAKTDGFPLDFGLCEISQLKNKDVPYYYRYLNESDFYYFNTPNTVRKCLCESDKFMKAKKLTKIITKDTKVGNNLAVENLKAGALQIARALSKNEVGLYKYKNLNLLLDKKYISILYKELKIQCER